MYGSVALGEILAELGCMHACILFCNVLKRQDTFGAHHLEPPGQGKVAAAVSKLLQIVHTAICSSLLDLRMPQLHPVDSV